jgi:hypothetical protein
MTKRPDLQLRKEAERRAAEFAARFGENITDQKRHECRRAGQLTAIADLMRDQALGGTVDFDKLKQAEDMAAAAVLALGMPEHLSVTKLEIELISARPLRNDDGTIRPWDQQDDRGRDAMIEQHWPGVPPEALAAYNARQAKAAGEVLHIVPPPDTGGDAGGASGAGGAGSTDSHGPAGGGGTQAAPAVTPDDPHNPWWAKLDPEREVPGEDADARHKRIIAERRWHAGDRPQPLRAPFDNQGAAAVYREGTPGFGAARFDHPKW